MFPLIKGLSRLKQKEGVRVNYALMSCHPISLRHIMNPDHLSSHNIAKKCSVHLSDSDMSLGYRCEKMERRRRRRRVIMMGVRDTWRSDSPPGSLIPIIVSLFRLEKPQRSHTSHLTPHFMLLSNHLSSSERNSTWCWYVYLSYWESVFLYSVQTVQIITTLTGGRSFTEKLYFSVIRCTAQ